MNQSNVIERVNDLLSRMTLEEKVAQMMQISYRSISREESLRWAQRGAGSFLHVLGECHSQPPFGS